MNHIKSKEEFDNAIKNNTGVLFYFTTVSCNVGIALETKVENLLKEKFSKIPMFIIDTNVLKELSAQENVFVVPTILVYFDKKEYIRKSRNISIRELNENISRLYNIIF